MTIVVAGSYRIPPENLDALKSHAGPLIAATRNEDGCLVYSFAVDLEDQGLIRVFERWRDQAALDAHFDTPHMKTWQAARGEFGVYDRMISAYEVGQTREI